MLRPLTILNDTWEIRKRIGQGSFCELYLARDIIDDETSFAAVKVQSGSIESSSVLRWEGDVLRALSGTACVPAFKYYGQHKGRDYLVMDLLGGEDMSKLRNRAREASGINLVTLPAAVYLAREMLSCIRAMHLKGYIHRDIKPSNFVRREKDSTKFAMIDFGLAKQHKDKDGKLRPKRESAEFRGTTLYASPFIHKGEDQCPRDDLYSLMLVLCDLICGRLPWSEAARAKDKQTVAQLKAEYLEQPRKFVDWVRGVVVAAEASRTNSKPRSNESSSSIISYPSPSSSAIEAAAAVTNFPDSVQCLLLDILFYLQGLKYEDEPDYDYIDHAIQTMINQVPRFDNHEVASPSYQFEGFSWSGGGGFDIKLSSSSSSSSYSTSNHNYNSNRSSSVIGGVAATTKTTIAATATATSAMMEYVTVDPVHQQRIICSRARVLGKAIQKARRQLVAAEVSTAATAASITAAIVTAAAAAPISCDDSSSNNNDIVISAEAEATTASIATAAGAAAATLVLQSTVVDSAAAATAITVPVAVAVPSAGAVETEDSFLLTSSCVAVGANNIEEEEEEIVDVKMTTESLPLQQLIGSPSTAAATAAAAGEVNEEDEEEHLLQLGLFELFPDVAAATAALDTGGAALLPPLDVVHAYDGAQDVPSIPSDPITRQVSAESFTTGVTAEGDDAALDVDCDLLLNESAIDDTDGAVLTDGGAIGSGTATPKGAVPSTVNTPRAEPHTSSKSSKNGTTTTTASAAGGSSSSNSAPPSSTSLPSRCVDLSLALKWKQLASELLTISEDVIQREPVELLEALIRDAGRFFEVDLGPGDEAWSEFRDIQQVAFRITELYYRNVGNRRSSSGSGSNPSSNRDSFPSGGGYGGGSSSSSGLKRLHPLSNSSSSNNRPNSESKKTKH